VERPKFEVSGKLGIGVFYHGEWQREFTIEPELVRNQIEAFCDPIMEGFVADAAKEEEAKKSGKKLVKSDPRLDYYTGIARLARQINKLGKIPREMIDGTMILDLHADDIEILQKAQKEVEEKVRFFRESLEAPADPDDSGGDEDRVVRGGAPGDAPGVS